MCGGTPNFNAEFQIVYIRIVAIVEFLSSLISQFALGGSFFSVAIVSLISLCVVRRFRPLLRQIHNAPFNYRPRPGSYQTFPLLGECFEVLNISSKNNTKIAMTQFSPKYALHCVISIRTWSLTIHSRRIASPFFPLLFHSLSFPFHSIPSIPSHSIPFHPIPFPPFHSIPFQSFPFFSFPPFHRKSYLRVKTQIEPDA